MNQQSGTARSLVLSYLDLRKAVGIIGFALRGAYAAIGVFHAGPFTSLDIGDICARVNCPADYLARKGNL